MFYLLFPLLGLKHRNIIGISIAMNKYTGESRIKLMLCNLHIKSNHDLRLNIPDYVANLVNYHINSSLFPCVLIICLQIISLEVFYI